MTGLWKQAKGLQGLFRAVNKNSHWRIGMRPRISNLDLICHQNLTWLSLYVHKFDINWHLGWLMYLHLYLSYVLPMKKTDAEILIKPTKKLDCFWQTQRLWSKKPRPYVTVFCQGNGCQTQNWSEGLDYDEVDSYCDHLIDMTMTVKK